MSVFMDLNLSYTTDKNRLQSLIETAAHRESPASRFHFRNSSLTAEVQFLLSGTLTLLASELNSRVSDVVDSLCSGPSVSSWFNTW